MRTGKYISQSPYGFQVRIIPRPYFSNSKYGGIRGAYLAARQARDTLLLAKGMLHLLLSKSIMPKSRMKNSTTGIIGVEYYVDWRYEDQGQWVAVGNIKGQTFRRSFAVRKWGDAEAFLKACNARYVRMGLLCIVGDIARLPCLPKVPYYITKE